MFIHERDRHMDGQTLHDGRPRLCIASRGKAFSDFDVTWRIY